MKLNFDSTIVLENDRVILRPMKADDYDGLLNYTTNEPEIWNYSLTAADTPENLKHYVAHALKGLEDRNSYPFIVIDKASNQIAGSTRFYDYQEGHNTVQLGYTWYGKAFQRTGLNRNCKYLLLEYAFEVLELDRVEFRADAQNSRSVTAMKSIGCVEEGILRSNCASPTDRRDSIVLSILKSEWEDEVKSNLRKKIRPL
ncbi:MAG: RimJ/RimL family protein N-acetyltransferase [Flavobacteriaceae bacterium]|jgi:RimJ/RimL family protein N-acetyltransferase